MMTCGDLGGQACPLVDEGPCPRGGRIATMPACHPMRMAVALAVEAEERGNCHAVSGHRIPLCEKDYGCRKCWLTWAAEVSDE